jgi:hypothetical protein
MSMIYALVARERLVLTDYSSFSGNFSQVAIEVRSSPRRSCRRPTSPRPSDST